MATKTLINGVVYIGSKIVTISGTTITYNDLLVEIYSTKIDHLYQNNLGIRPIAESKGDRGSEEPIVQIIDLKKITETLTISGYLEDESSESASSKKSNILTMGKNEGELTIIWNQGIHQNYWFPNPDARFHGVFINRCLFTETSGKVGDSDTTGNFAPERKIAIILNLVRGRDI